MWGMSYTFVKWGIGYLAPIHLLFLRFFVSLVLLFIFSFGNLPRLSLKTILRCALIGLIIAVSHGFSVIGIEKSFAVDAALLYALEPIVAIVFARLILKEKMDFVRIVALIMALTGFVILSNINSFNLLSNMTFVGNFLMLIGICADGLFSPVSKPVLENYPARVILMIIIFFATLFISPFVAMTPVKQTVFSWQAIVSVLYLSVICTAIGWTAWLHYLRKLPVSVMAISVFIQPIVGPFFSYFTLGEQISARIWFGGVIILSAVLLVTLKRKNTKEEVFAEVVSH